MAKVIRSKQFDVPAEEMWKRIGDFQALHTWHPAIEATEPKDGGASRVLTIAGGGGQVLETLLDHGDHFYAYRIDESPLPVADYQAMIRVKETRPGACEVEWEAEFEPSGMSEDDAVATMGGIFEAGLDAL